MGQGFDILKAAAAGEQIQTGRRRRQQRFLQRQARNQRMPLRRPAAQAGRGVATADRDRPAAWREPALANPAAKFTAVVVLPTPPF